MKRLLSIFVLFVAFHDLKNNVIFIAPGEVSVIYDDIYYENANIAIEKHCTTIMLKNGTHFCVSESPDQAANKLEKGSRPRAKSSY